MYAHRFDPISLVAGMVLLAIGIPSLLGGFDLWTIRWEWAAPLLAIAAGVGLLLSGLRARSTTSPPSDVDGVDEPPVEEEL